MNAPQARALVWDAIYQVLDNWVFRILVLLALVPVLATFMIGFREHEIVFLFGLKHWSYDGLLGLLGGPQGGLSDVQDAQGLVIEVILKIVFDYLAGSIGVLFCIAAAAFFVPRMIEKGAADVMFHKPLGRLTFYLSRYLAGLFFIGIVAGIGVTGMYLGILLVSGRNDPGILFGAVTLTYLFGLVYSVCMLVGILTRSTVASILLTVIFFFCNGCVQQFWAGAEQFKAAKEAHEAQVAAPLPEGEGDEVVEPETEADEETAGEEDDGLLKRAFFLVLNTLHYTLPKTYDADFIARKMRRSVDPPAYKDDDTLVTVFRVPPELRRLPLGEVDVGSIPPDVETLLGELRFAAAGRDEPVAYTLWRRPAETTEDERNGRTRVRRETTSRAASALAGVLQAVARDGSVERETITFGSSAKGSPTGAYELKWIEDTASGPRERVAVVFKGTDADWVYTLWVDAPPEADSDVLVEHVDRVMGKDDNVLNKASWYEEQLRLDAPLKFNILFSVGSSLAFTAVMLLLGWWRLSRIEF